MKEKFSHKRIPLGYQFMYPMNATSGNIPGIRKLESLSHNILCAFIASGESPTQDIIEESILAAKTMIDRIEQLYGSFEDPSDYLK